MGELLLIQEIGKTVSNSGESQKNQETWTIWQWFVEIFKKTVTEKPGKYVLLGNNLFSHFNLKSYQNCRTKCLFCYASTKHYAIIAAVRCLFFHWWMNHGGKFCKNGKERFEQREVWSNSFSHLFLNDSSTHNCNWSNTIWNLDFEPQESFL